MVDYKEKYEKMRTLVLALACAIAGIIIALIIIATLPDPDPEPLQIVSKYEAEGKCYIETWIEVTPEEYIGYDIGDEYEEKR